MQFDLPSIKLFVGLGNPGKNYTLTRHNAGFMWVDFLRDELDSTASWTTQDKFEAEICKVVRPELQLLLAKPQTFMNSSGRSVQAIMRYYKLKPDQVLIAYDDLDIPLGKFKLQLGKGPKVHNGLNSIQQFLKTDTFWNLRIGIENREVKGNSQISGNAYALSNFAPTEREELKEVFHKIHQTHF